MLGKYVLEKYVNVDYSSNNLRYINRENKMYYISDVQRTVKSWDKEPREYVFIYKWATKFVKDASNALGFRRSMSHLLNTDGTMTHYVLNSPSEAKCEHTFDEVFGNDLRNIQDPEDYPLCERLYMADKSPRATEDESGYYKLSLNLCNDNEPLTNLLRKLFMVKDVYRVWGISEDNKETILTKSSTLFQLVHFGENEKSLSFEENKSNNTIMFWLFDDRLVYQYETGKKTW